MSDKDCPQHVNISVKLNYGSNVPPEGYVYGTSVAHQTWCRPCIEKFVPFPELQKLTPPEREVSDTEIIINLLERLGFSRQQ